jgi:hypothetical protein
MFEPELYFTLDTTAMFKGAVPSIFLLIVFWSGLIEKAVSTFFFPFSTTTIGLIFSLSRD